MQKLTDDLFNAARPLWDAQLQHPFVRGIADGTLDPETFKNWVRQDYLYLKEYSRMFAWGAARSDRLAAMQWYAKILDLTLNLEMGLHRTYAERFDITPDDLELMRDICQTGNDVAQAVRSGRADCGVATRSAAATAGVDFVPLVWENFDLVLRQRDYFQPQPQQLFAFMRSDAFAAKAADLGGYDVSGAGRVRLVN